MPTGASPGSWWRLPSEVSSRVVEHRHSLTFLARRAVWEPLFGPKPGSSDEGRGCGSGREDEGCRSTRTNANERESIDGPLPERRAPRGITVGGEPTFEVRERVLVSNAAFDLLAAPIVEAQAGFAHLVALCKLCCLFQQLVVVKPRIVRHEDLPAEHPS